jgi:hypothetical protein
MSPPEVPFETVQKWQEIVNIIPEIMHVPSALVMKVEPPNIKVSYRVSRTVIRMKGTNSPLSTRVSTARQ